MSCHHLKANLFKLEDMEGRLNSEIGSFSFQTVANLRLYSLTRRSLTEQIRLYHGLLAFWRKLTQSLDFALEVWFMKTTSSPPWTAFLNTTRMYNNIRIWLYIHMKHMFHFYRIWCHCSRILNLVIGKSIVKYEEKLDFKRIIW